MPVAPPLLMRRNGLLRPPDRVHAEPFGVADADHRVRRQRIHDRLDGIEVEAGVLHRAPDAFAHQFRIAGIVTTRAELRLADADDADADRCSWPRLPSPARRPPGTAWQTRCRRAPGRIVRPPPDARPARPRTWLATSAIRISPVQNTGFKVSTPPDRLTGSGRRWRSCHPRRAPPSHDADTATAHS